MRKKSDQKKDKENKQLQDNQTKKVKLKNTEQEQKVNKKLQVTFREFLEVQASLLPAVNFGPGTTAFVDSIRTWNAQALTNPKMCADIIVWPEGGLPMAVPNDVPRENGIKKLLINTSKKEMKNLPDNLRSDKFKNKGVRVPQPESQPSGLKDSPVSPETSLKSDSSSGLVLDDADTELPPDILESLQHSSEIGQRNVEQNMNTNTDDEGAHIPKHAQVTKK